MHMLPQTYVYGILVVSQRNRFCSKSVLLPRWIKPALTVTSRGAYEAAVHKSEVNLNSTQRVGQY